MSEIRRDRNFTMHWRLDLAKELNWQPNQTSS